MIYNRAYLYLQIPTENHRNLVNFVPASLKLHTHLTIVCIDGDVEDLVALFEEIARNGETLGHEDLNCADNSGRVSFKKTIFFVNLGIA